MDSKQRGWKGMLGPFDSSRRTPAREGSFVGSWRVLIFALLLSNILANFGFALQEVEATASAEELFIGESFTYQVDVRNADNPSPPNMAPFQELFEVVEAGNESRNQSSTMIINGRISQSNIRSHVYQYRLTPKEVGQLRIPEAKVTLQGKDYLSNSLPLQVNPIEKQDVVVVEVMTEPSRVYPTQPFSATLKILVKPIPEDSENSPLRPLVRRPPHIEANWADVPQGLLSNEKSQWLQPLLARDGIGFSLNDISARTGSFFDGAKSAIFGLSKGREIRKGMDGEPIEYYSYELKRSFTAEKAGEYSFGPVTVSGEFAIGLRRNRYAVKRIVAISEKSIVAVREVPSPRPATFCGGIGDYTWKGSATPTKLRIGDPLTLTLEVERGPLSGSLELISAPDISQIETLASQFDLIDKNPTGRIEGSTKKFSYALRPKQADASIPSLTITTFDPAGERFVEVSTEPIPLEVTEATKMTNGDLIGSLTNPTGTEIKTRSEGIFQNKTDPSLLQDERVRWSFWIQWTLGTWALSGLLMGILVLHRKRIGDPLRLRQQRARSKAQSRLIEAKLSWKQDQPKEAMRLVRSSILGLIADSKSLVVDGMTTSDVDMALAKAPVPEATHRSILALLESIEAAEYGAGQSINLGAMIEEATKLIDEAGRYLERGAQ